MNGNFKPWDEAVPINPQRIPVSDTTPTQAVAGEDRVQARQTSVIGPLLTEIVGTGNANWRSNYPKPKNGAAMRNTIKASHRLRKARRSTLALSAPEIEFHPDKEDER